MSNILAWKTGSTASTLTPYTSEIYTLLLMQTHLGVYIVTKKNATTYSQAQEVRHTHMSTYALYREAIL